MDDDLYFGSQMIYNGKHYYYDNDECMPFIIMPDCSIIGDKRLWNGTSDCHENIIGEYLIDKYDLNCTEYEWQDGDFPSNVPEENINAANKEYNYIIDQGICGRVFKTDDDNAVFLFTNETEDNKQLILQGINKVAAKLHIPMQDVYIAAITKDDDFDVMPKLYPLDIWEALKIDKDPDKARELQILHTKAAMAKRKAFAQFRQDRDANNAQKTLKYKQMLNQEEHKYIGRIIRESIQKLFF